MDNLVYLNGEYIQASKAKISIFDRGFLFADSVYEVIPVYQGCLYFLDKHLHRLEASLASTKIPTPKVNWTTIFEELIRHNGSGNMQIYLQITRGNQGIRKHDLPKEPTPTIVAFTLHTPYPALADKQRGLHAKLVEDIRWVHCDIKTTAMLANIMLNDEAVSNGDHIALLLRDNYLTEGASSNVFTVDAHGVIRTPPRNQLCLHGITQQVVIELIQALGWEFREENISQEALLQSKEVWITSTTKEIYPITRINGMIIGTGCGGHYWQQLDKKYQQLIKKTYDK